MTIAEILFLAAGGAAIYLLLRPLQRWLEAWLGTHVFARRTRVRRQIIDVDFTHDSSHRKDDPET
jgi:hypothetical protein